MQTDSTTTSQSTQQKNKLYQQWFPFVICIPAGIIVTVLCLLLASIVVSRVDIPALVSVFSLISLALGSFVSGLLTAMAFRKEKFVMGAVSGVLFCLILIVLNILFFREPITIMSFVKYIVVIISSIGATYFIKPKKRKTKR